MATKKLYDACCRAMTKGKPLVISSSNETLHIVKRPPLKELFGRKCLVGKLEFERCSEREKRRHLNEDSILRMFYLERR